MSPWWLFLLVPAAMILFSLAGQLAVYLYFKERPMGFMALLNRIAKATEAQELVQVQTNNLIGRSNELLTQINEAIQAGNAILVMNSDALTAIADSTKRLADALADEVVGIAVEHNPPTPQE